VKLVIIIAIAFIFGIGMMTFSSTVLAQEESEILDTPIVTPSDTPTNLTPTLDNDSIGIFAIIGVMISAVGITIGFLYNARSIRQNTRTRYYQIQKDIEKRYHEAMVMYNEDAAERELRIINLAIFLIKIVNREMIPKKSYCSLL